MCELTLYAVFCEKKFFLESFIALIKFGWVNAFIETAVRLHLIGGNRVTERKGRFSSNCTKERHLLDYVRLISRGVING